MPRTYEVIYRRVSEIERNIDRNHRITVEAQYPKHAERLAARPGRVIRSVSLILKEDPKVEVLTGHPDTQLISLDPEAAPSPEAVDPHEDLKNLDGESEAPVAEAKATIIETTQVPPAMLQPSGSPGLEKLLNHGSLGLLSAYPQDKLEKLMKHSSFGLLSEYPKDKLEMLMNSSYLRNTQIPPSIALLMKDQVGEAGLHPYPAAAFDPASSAVVAVPAAEVEAQVPWPGPEVPEPQAPAPDAEPAAAPEDTAAPAFEEPTPSSASESTKRLRRAALWVVVITLATDLSFAVAQRGYGAAILSFAIGMSASMVLAFLSILSDRDR